MISSQGYVKIRVGKTHPLADTNGYTYEHLLVWCAAGNSRPGPGFLLHHKDEDRANNKYDNLELLSKKEHNRLHRLNHPRVKNGRWAKVTEGTVTHH